MANLTFAGLFAKASTYSLTKTQDSLKLKLSAGSVQVKFGVPVVVDENGDLSDDSYMDAAKAKGVIISFTGDVRESIKLAAKRAANAEQAADFVADLLTGSIAADDKAAAAKS